MNGIKTISNVLSIDVEEYFQATAFNGNAPIAVWDNYESRVERPTRNLLATLAKYDTKATFFVVGWVAKRHPGLVKAIQEEGHEIACHSYAHREISEQGPSAFRKDLRLAKSILEDITGRPIRGYRAPTFSITNETLWALDILIEEGFQYDSSIFPIHHDRYGIPKAERFPGVIGRGNGSEIWEFPMSTIRIMGVNFPFSGGGYMRLLPPSFVSRAIETVNRRGQPVIVYVHPWEFDPYQPRIGASFVTKFRHYHNIGRMDARFEHLLATHRFAPVSDVLRSYEEPSCLATAAPDAQQKAGLAARRRRSLAPSLITSDVG